MVDQSKELITQNQLLFIIMRKFTKVYKYKTSTAYIYTRCRTSPDYNVGPETQHKGWAQMHSPLLLVFSKVGPQFFSNFSMGNNACTEALLTKKRFWMRFRYKQLRMTRFPLRNNFFLKKKKIVETLLARDPS